VTGITKGKGTYVITLSNNGRHYKAEETVLALSIDHDDGHFFHLADIEDLLVGTNEIPSGLCGLYFENDFEVRSVRYF